MMQGKRGNSHGQFQTFFINWKLNRYVWQVVINLGIRFRTNSRVKGGVFMILGYRTDYKTDVPDKLKAEELDR